MVDVSDMPYNKFSHKTKMIFSFLPEIEGRNNIHFFSTYKPESMFHFLLTSHYKKLYIYDWLNQIIVLTRRSVEFVCPMPIHRYTPSKRVTDVFADYPLNQQLDLDLDIDNIPIHSMMKPSKMYPFVHWTPAGMEYVGHQPALFHKQYRPVPEMSVYYSYV